MEFLSRAVESVLREHPAWSTRPLHVLEIAGGSGALSRHIATCLGPDRVRVTLVDIDSAAVAAAARDAPPNLRCMVADAARLGEEVRPAGGWRGWVAGEGWTAGGSLAVWESRAGGEGRVAGAWGVAADGGVVGAGGTAGREEGAMVWTGSGLSEVGMGEGGLGVGEAGVEGLGVGGLGVGSVDMVVGLHACGGLSDLILALAVDRAAAFCLCTCCFLSHPKMRVPAPRATSTGARAVASSVTTSAEVAAGREGDSRVSQAGGDRKAGVADGGGGASPLGTVSTRDARIRHEAGAEDAAEQLGSGAPRLQVERDDWLGVAAADLRPLLHLAELQGNPDAARMASHSVNAVRAATAERRWREAHGCTGTRLQVSIEAFEAKYSPRNLCMVGRVVREELTSSESTSR